MLTKQSHPLTLNHSVQGYVMNNKNTTCVGSPTKHFAKPQSSKRT